MSCHHAQLCIHVVYISTINRCFINYKPFYVTNLMLEATILGSELVRSTCGFIRIQDNVWRHVVLSYV
ncbi:unnamed protein product [Arabidopsis halleri]